MKVLRIENNLLTSKHTQVKNSRQNSPITEPEVEKTLPSFDSKGMSIAFKALKVKTGGLVTGANLQKLMAEIALVKEKLKILANSNFSKKTKEIVDAEDIVRKYKYWQANHSSIYENAVRKAEKARQEEKDKHSGWSNFWHNHGEKEYNDTMRREYYNLRDLYDVGYTAYTIAQTKVNAYEEVQRITDESKEKEREQLLKTLGILEASISQASIRDAVNEAMNNDGGLEDRIAGYDITKNEIERSFVSPLIENVKNGNNDLRIPPAVMLYGATGCGKTSMLNAIKNQVKGYARVIDISAIEETRFLDKLDTFLGEAKKHYLQTKNKTGQGERTILLLNEAEVFLATNPEDMGTSGLFFDKADIRKMERYNKNLNCPSIVTKMKSYLDTISLLPTEENPNGSATTIFITSNYPHLIHRDLLSRDGEFGKMLTIPVRPAANEDLREVIKYYFTKLSNFIEQIKFFAKQENADELIDSITILSNKGKDVIKSKIKDGTIENMAIDPTLGGFKNIDMFIRGNNPSIRKGAYSNARIENIAKRAFVNYIENPAIPYEKHFLEVKSQKGVDISPAAYRQFENICDMVENPTKFKQKQSKEIGNDIRELIEKYDNGEITKEELSSLKLAIKDIKSKYAELKNNSNLSETEIKIKKQYEEFLDTIESIEFPEY